MDRVENRSVRTIRGRTSEDKGMIMYEVCVMEEELWGWKEKHDAPKRGFLCMRREME